MRKKNNVMKVWVKSVGSAKTPIVGTYDKDHVGFRKRGKPRIRLGDHLFLYAPGGSKRIFALAEALDDPEHDPQYNPNQEGSCPWKLRIRYLRGPLPVSSGVFIGEVLSRYPDATMSLRQASHIELRDEEERRLAYKKLEEAANNVGT